MRKRTAAEVRGRSRVTLLLGLAAACPWLYAQDAPPAAPKPDFSERPACLVRRIVDGDTVVVALGEGEATVDLIGVATPEPGQIYHDESKRFLGNLLVGEAVYLKHEGEATATAPADRVRGYLFRVPDGLFINLEIARQGYGRVAAEPPFEHQKLFQFYEERAKAAGKGLWSPRVDGQTTIGAPAAHESPTSRASTRADDPIVYVTETGKKYHRKGCQHLRKSCIPLRLSQAKQRGYTPCARCKPPQ
jgi:endonuclease YncB( thermonuclease family)